MPCEISFGSSDSREVLKSNEFPAVWPEVLETTYIPKAAVKMLKPFLDSSSWLNFNFQWEGDGDAIRSLHLELTQVLLIFNSHADGLSL